MNWLKEIGHEAHVGRAATRSLTVAVVLLALGACGPEGVNVKNPGTGLPGEARHVMSERSLEKLAKRATPEQIQWVIDHPVHARDYESAEERIDAISVRRNIIINSAELDFDRPADSNGDHPLTKEFQPRFEAMVASIYDNTSDSYDAMHAALEALARKTGELLRGGLDIRSPITPVEGTGVVQGAMSTVLTVVDRLSPSDPSYVEGPAARVAFTMRTDSDEVVRVTHIQEQE